MDNQWIWVLLLIMAAVEIVVWFIAHLVEKERKEPIPSFPAPTSSKAVMKTWCAPSFPSRLSPITPGILVCVEGEGGQLIYYHRDPRVEPEQIPRFFQEGLDVLDLWIQKKGVAENLDLIGLDGV
jgi:hypothetical protein